jgi:hypothetical protein
MSTARAVSRMSAAAGDERTTTRTSPLGARAMPGKPSAPPGPHCANTVAATCDEHDVVGSQKSSFILWSTAIAYIAVSCDAHESSGVPRARACVRGAL